jgi:hypothetical protein
MPILDVFSRREKLERGEYPDVYQYETLPDSFRVQAWHIICDALGSGRSFQWQINVDSIHTFVSDFLKREYGLRQLSKRDVGDAAAVSEFFFAATDRRRVLDVIDLYFQSIVTYVAGSDYQSTTVDRRLSPDEAVADLNRRFKENGIGYQFESGKLIRLDSAYLHAEAVKPALGVLSDPRFKGANEEFLAAHEHYREGRNEECLVECCKAFESTMKTICTEHQWPFNATDTAKTLIATCLANGLIPSYLDNQMTSLRTLFESGIPTVRNKVGGHGQGAVPRVVPEFLARYVLNQTATTILFLVEADSAAAA